mmetsp:Transcript_18622/g.52597  ORF Transcript_18622/g.52597 Transcript_18622/m.52597 type:complete len:260 (+) Transcript_18622:917-1696(+)
MIAARQAKTVLDHLSHLPLLRRRRQRRDRDRAPAGAPHERRPAARRAARGLAHDHRPSLQAGRVELVPTPRQGPHLLARLDVLLADHAQPLRLRDLERGALGREALRRAPAARAAALLHLSHHSLLRRSLGPGGARWRSAARLRVRGLGVAIALRYRRHAQHNKGAPRPAEPLTLSGLVASWRDAEDPSNCAVEALRQAAGALLVVTVGGIDAAWHRGRHGRSQLAVGRHDARLRAAQGEDAEPPRTELQPCNGPGRLA